MNKRVEVIEFATPYGKSIRMYCNENNDIDYFKVSVTFDNGADIEDALSKRLGQDHNFYGLLHLAEHMAFKSTENYSATEIDQTIRKIGKHNAYTSTNELHFFMSTISKYSMEVVSMLCEIAFSDHKFNTQEELESERDVVVSEVNSYYSDKVNNQKLEASAIMNGLSTKANIIGDTDVISNCTLEMLTYIKNSVMINSNIDITINYNKNNVDIVKIGDMLLNASDDAVNSISDAPILSTSEIYPALVNGNDYFIESAVIDRIVEDTTSFVTYMKIDAATTRFKWMNEVDGYLYKLAKQSIFKVLRSDKGLFYNMYFSTVNYNANKFSLIAQCTHDEGKSDEILDALIEVLKYNAENYSVEDHDSLLNTIYVEYNMSLSSNKEFDYVGNIRPFVDELIPYIQGDIKNAYMNYIKDNLTYENVKAYINEIYEMVANKDNKYTKNIIKYRLP